MSFLDNFPYTNIHELNLGWVLRVLKAMGVKLDEYTDKVDELTDEASKVTPIRLAIEQTE